MLSTTYDADADALYISLRKGRVARTEPLDPWTLVDEDASGSALGVEVLHPAREWPLAVFLERYKVEGDNRHLLEEMFPPAVTGRPPSLFQAARAHHDTGTAAEACRV